MKRFLSIRFLSTKNFATHSAPQLSQNQLPRYATEGAKLVGVGLFSYSAVQLYARSFDRHYTSYQERFKAMTHDDATEWVNAKDVKGQWLILHGMPLVVGAMTINERNAMHKAFKDTYGKEHALSNVYRPGVF